MPNSDTSTFETFGELLRYLRQRARLTQDELGSAVGYSRAHLARLESNQRTPEVSAVRARFIEALRLERESEWANKLIALAIGARDEGADDEQPATEEIAPPQPDTLPTICRLR